MTEQELTRIDEVAERFLRSASMLNDMDAEIKRWQNATGQRYSDYPHPIMVANTESYNELVGIFVGMELLPSEGISFETQIHAVFACARTWIVARTLSRSAEVGNGNPD